MYIDKELCFNTVSANVITAQSETTVAAHNSTNVIDLTHIPRHVIDNMFFVFQIEAAIVSAGGGTLQIDLVTSAATALTTAQTLWSTGVVANATIVAWTANSTVYQIRIPPVMLLQYMGVIYTIGTAVYTAGSWRAFITPDVSIGTPATP